MSLDKDPEQWVCSGHSLAEVVIVVDGQQVSMNVCVANQNLHVGDAMEVHDQLKELLKFARLCSVHGEPAELCSILREKETEELT